MNTSSLTETLGLQAASKPPTHTGACRDGVLTNAHAKLKTLEQSDCRIFLVHDTLIVGEYLTARTVSLFPSKGRPINGRIGDDSAVPASQALSPKRKPKIE